MNGAGDIEDKFLLGHDESSASASANNNNQNQEQEEDVNKIAQNEELLNNNNNPNDNKSKRKSKARKKEEKELKKQEKKERFRRALDELKDGKWKSVKKCAQAHNVASRTLYSLFSSGQDYVGKGKMLTVFSKD